MKEYIVSTDTAYEFEMSRFEELQELIRCKDCEYFSEDSWNDTFYCGLGSVGNCQTVKEDDYCSWAERKDDESESDY